MQPCDAAHALNALSTTSVILYDVSTLPPTTAALDDGLMNVFSGVIIYNIMNREWIYCYWSETSLVEWNVSVN
jgi:hypothetical protein